MKSPKRIIKLEKEALKNFIRIGLCQPKFYKRSSWETAKTIMECLCDNSDLVFRHDYGQGQGKYTVRVTSFIGLTWEESVEKLYNKYIKVYNL